MKKLFGLFAIAFATQASANVINIECKNHQQSNMRMMTVALSDDQTAGTLSMEIHFTNSDSIITNKTLTSSVLLNSAVDGKYIFAADKDPYNGQVGTYFWTFAFPVNFLQAGTLSSAFQGSNSATFAGWQWQGTPSGNGNNSGLGMLYDWYCRAI